MRVCTVIALACALLIPDSLARPFTQGEKRRRDVNPFPDSVPTDDGRLEPCFKPVTQTLVNGTQSRVVNECCDGYTGENCDEKEPEGGSGDRKVEFDQIDPCKNLECMGVEDAHCLTITKCGNRWPVFLLSDGTLAQCTNGQPVNVTQLTCTERCVTDPCAGQTCPMHPNAFCVHTACDCNEPMWLLDSGVQVDCETGEMLSPQEAKERRRRKRQALTDTPPPAATVCS